MWDDDSNTLTTFQLIFSYHDFLRNMTAFPIYLATESVAAYNDLKCDISVI